MPPPQRKETGTESSRRTTTQQLLLHDPVQSRVSQTQVSHSTTSTTTATSSNSRVCCWRSRGGSPRHHRQHHRHKSQHQHGEQTTHQDDNSSSSEELIVRSRFVWSTECIRCWRGRRQLFSSCSLLFLVLFVFVSCVVPLSTPSSTHVSTSSTTTIATTSSSSTLDEDDEDVGGEESWREYGCPTAKLWIETNGSFCFILRNSSFIRNRTELMVRERRAVDMFCELDRILEKVDCAQPYSVNVDRQQCWLCREAYRDWVCAMTTDTLEDGRVDCDGGVMPCPSCASICHQVMRLCPYLTPDRVQFDESGDAIAHVSQYGGHPAFYCPLENIHASDPAYTSECNSSDLYTSHEDPDYVHNLCAADAQYVTKKRRGLGNKRSSSNATLSYVPHYTTCCWTYASSLVNQSGQLEESIKDHGTGYHQNRVILNCCDVNGNCTSSDPDRVKVNVTATVWANSTLSSSSSSTELAVVTVTSSPVQSPVLFGGTLRTANNQVRGEDGKFRELSNAYLHDEPMDDDEEDEEEEEEEEDDDEEYYDDSSSDGGGMFGGRSSSGGNSNERNRNRHLSSSSSSSSSSSMRNAFVRRNNRFYVEESSSSVISIHRDNKIYSTRESRSVHEGGAAATTAAAFYIHDETNSANSGGGGGYYYSLYRGSSVVMGNVLGCVISAIIPPLVSCLLLTCSVNLHSVSCVCSFVIAEVVLGFPVGCYSDGVTGVVSFFVLAFRIVCVVALSCCCGGGGGGECCWSGGHARSRTKTHKQVLVVESSTNRSSRRVPLTTSIRNERYVGVVDNNYNYNYVKKLLCVTTTTTTTNTAPAAVNTIVRETLFIQQQQQRQVYNDLSRWRCYVDDEGLIWWPSSSSPPHHHQQQQQITFVVVVVTAAAADVVVLLLLLPLPRFKKPLIMKTTTATTAAVIIVRRCSRQRCSCCEYKLLLQRFVSNYSNLLLMNLPINNIKKIIKLLGSLRLSHRKLVVINLIIISPCSHVTTRTIIYLNNVVICRRTNVCNRVVMGNRLLCSIMCT